MKAPTQPAPEDVAAAINAAAMATAGMPDGGTSNLDTVVINVSRSYERITRRIKTLAGVYVGKRVGAYTLPMGSFGQGLRRTAAAEAAAKHLRSLGYSAHVSYIID